MIAQSSDLNFSLARLRRSALPFKTRLAEPIEALEAAFAEDYDGRQPSSKSVEGLIGFLEASPPSGYPDLTLTPAGDCYAEWRGSHGKVAIEFTASGPPAIWSSAPFFAIPDDHNSADGVSDIMVR